MNSSRDPLPAGEVYAERVPWEAGGMNEPELLAAARDGSEDAFARLITPYRGALKAHCYRMLGSVHDAEDALQEALLAAWRGLAGFEGRSSLRSWLYTIATNACLRAIERRPRRVLPIDHGPATADPHVAPGAPLAEPVWIEPFPDEGPAVADERASPDARYEQRESVELAFVAALQHLPARQRAVLILRDVLGFSGGEVAEALEMTPAAVYSALQRAHRTVDERLPERTQQATLRSLGDEGLREIVEAFVDAWERADVDALAARLAADAALTMPPTPTWFRGREAIAAFLRDFPLSGRTRWRAVATRANGQPAFGLYPWSDEAHAFRPGELAVLTLEGDRIAELTIFRDPSLPTRFGLPAVIAS
jgi:RNA polymerase sigma-70 factor (ECF subfamily)